MSFESNSQIVDLTGKRFGRLLVLRRGRVKSSVRKCSTRNPRNRNRNYWICQCDCGNQKEVSKDTLSQGLTRSCGCLRRERARDMVGDRHPSWKGGRNYNGDGYVTINIGPGRNRLEHIVVMERCIGRDLLPDETVHHVNGIRDDNRIDNLELWSSNHPSGQRIPDKVNWAMEILRVYDPQSYEKLAK